MDVGFQSYGLFQEPWWLNACAPGKWEEVTVTKNSQVVGRLPFVRRVHRGLTILGMPQLTQYLGPWIRPAEGKYANILSSEKDILEQLIAALPRFDLFHQNFAPDLENWLPFYWSGFSQTSRVTYRISDLSNLEAVWKETKENIRTDVRKAEKLLKVRDDLGLEKFLEVNSKSFKRQDMEVPYTDAYVRAIDKACQERKQGKMLFAEDAQGRIHAVAYIVFDSRLAYYILGGGDPELRNSGAHSFLMWEAIKFSASVSKAFDFEGSQIQSVERFVRAFGARQFWYHSISKRSRRRKIIELGRDFLATAFSRSS
jgi:hypothetical protein